MIVEVRLFARARVLAGRDQITVELPATATVAALRSAIAAQYETLAPLSRSLLIALGNEYASEDAVVTPEFIVAAFPPVSGG